MESGPRSLKDVYPNIILKKKLAPLPLFNQNRSPKHLFQSPTRQQLITEPKSLRTSSQTTTNLRASKIIQNEFNSVNNYGRLCDQPFLEFSSFHYGQFLGSSNKNKVVLEPLSKSKQTKQQLVGRNSSLQDLKSKAREPLIKIEDNAEPAPVNTHIVSKPKKEKDHRTTIEHAYTINGYEAIIKFVSLVIVLESKDDHNQKPITIHVGKNDLVKIYRSSHSQIEKVVLDSLLLKHEHFKINIKKAKVINTDQSEEDDAYPEKSEELQFTFHDKTYSATIHYPYLEMTIPSLDYKEKIMLKPIYLANLFEEKFNNLQDYASKFAIPSQVFKGKDEMHIEELEKLPTIIKKVAKFEDFGGLILFKSTEIHLKNTSDIEPHIIMGDEEALTPRSKRILQRKRTSINSILLRLKLTDINRLVRCTAEEITDLIKTSVLIEEGTGFAIQLDEEKMNNYQQKDQIETDFLPECSENFTIRFNRFIYEGFVKFPTLELYIPETSYRDVIQLKPSQLQDLLDHEFNNMNDYMHLFKKPTREEIPETDHTTNVQQETSLPQVVEEHNNMNDYPAEEKPLSYTQHTISTRKI